MTTRVYLIRHGETEWNRRGILQGTTDTPLNEEGRRQARLLGERLAGIALDAAYTSPLRRARETAETVLQRHPAMELRALSALREISYGLWQGRGIAPAGRCSPGLEWRWRDEPWRVRFPGGEMLQEVLARVSEAWDRLVATHPGEAVLLSGHGHVNRVLLIHVLRWPRERFWEIEQPNGCCHLLEIGGREPTLSVVTR